MNRTVICRIKKSFHDHSLETEKEGTRRRMIAIPAPFPYGLSEREEKERRL